jgi:hypothetical protein
MTVLGGSGLVRVKVVAMSAKEARAATTTGQRDERGRKPGKLFGMITGF